jgi:formylglycine-generating enzyme required for sulfatase activity
MKKGVQMNQFLLAAQTILPRILGGALLIGLPSLIAANELQRPKSEESSRSGLTQGKVDLGLVNLPALRRAVRDLSQTYPQEYPQGPEYLIRIEQYEKQLPEIQKGLERGESQAPARAKEIIAFQREALLSNPLLDFERLLLIKRKPLGDPRRATGDKSNDKGLGKFLGLPQQSSWQLHTMPNTTGWENEIAILSPVQPEGKLTTFYRPSKQGGLINEIDLHFDADRLMFSLPDARKKWQIYEIGIDGENLRQLSPKDQPDVHSLDSCYLPNGKIMFISTACFQGVPCNPSVNVGMSYLMDADGSNIRQLCFEQDHNFCPTVMNDGRVMYLRWEYTDIPHVWARFLFTMNPDGTGQREFYGSGGYWPNAIFFARPIPNHPTKVVGIVTGHHVGRVGELVIFDPALGRTENEGVIQRIPGYGKKVDPLIEDKLTLLTWPKYLHPWPLSDKYFLVSCKPRPNDLWGIYLVDSFDNITLIKEVEEYALLEPIPLKKRPTPPVLVDRVDPRRKDALVYLEDIYTGPGLKDVPKGAVKKLRLYTYHFGYRTIAGINHRVGADGPWEPKRIMGTVPVYEDGSAFFRVPANAPISIQPLDRDGKALQLMRSWMTAMPGEFVSCTGCHEKQNSGPLNRGALAARQVPSEINPWYGPERGFSFDREVQPVLDNYCVSCHDGSERKDGKQIPNLKANQQKWFAYRNGDPKAKVFTTDDCESLVKKYGGVFSPSYITLRSYIRVGGLESDLRLLAPGEFSADTSELVQMLKKGHHGVELGAEAWDRLYTWIDLNGTAHGTWTEIVGRDKLRNDHKRRLELRKLYGGPTEDPEVYPKTNPKPIKPVPPKPTPNVNLENVVAGNWPFDAAEAKRRQGAGGKIQKSIDLGDGAKLELVRIPAGEFVMGDAKGNQDELPLTPVKITRSFWMGKCEITNEQFSRFDSSHDSKFEHKGSWQFNQWDLGWDLNRPKQPVVRVSWKEALAFCKWLTQKTGMKVTLPTEAQWEWACRAGSQTPLFYGELNVDFSPFANMADITAREYVYDARDHYPPDLIPRDERFNDKKLISSSVGSYQPNPWQLHDMHGNVWEWTRSTCQPYPYHENDGRNDLEPSGQKIVRGGSWYDRPKRCRSAFRLSYPAWQKVFNVGFRIVVEDEPSVQIAIKKR